MKPKRTAASKPVEKPLRGEAAWLAAKAEIARRNDAARARAAADGAAIAARRAEERLAAERLEAANLPQQPRPDRSPTATNPSPGLDRGR
jgi:hypothetical protein